jgi:hypothetical protein
MIIDAFGQNYRVIWWISLACSIPALILVLMIDPAEGLGQAQTAGDTATEGR